MNGRRPVLVVALTCALVLVISSGGFTASTAERNIAITAGTDGDALLGVETEPVELASGTHDAVALLAIANNLQTAIEVDVAIDASGRPTPPDLQSGPDPVSTPLTVGESVDVTAGITCGGAADRTEQFTIQITASTEDGSSVELDRDVTVTCSGSPNRGPSRRRNGTPAGANPHTQENR